MDPAPLPSESAVTMTFPTAPVPSLSALISLTLTDSTLVTVMSPSFERTGPPISVLPPRLSMMRSATSVRTSTAVPAIRAPVSPALAAVPRMRMGPALPEVALETRTAFERTCVGRPACAGRICHTDQRDAGCSSGINRDLAGKEIDSGAKIVRVVASRAVDRDVTVDGHNRCGGVADLYAVIQLRASAADPVDIDRGCPR